jgi:hypothetical protein
MFRAQLLYVSGTLPAVRRLPVFQPESALRIIEVQESEKLLAEGTVVVQVAICTRQL